MMPPVKTKAVAPARAAARLQQAFAPERRSDWIAASAAILAGAPIDTPIQKRQGYTPLLIASGAMDEIPWLLDHGASMEPVNPEETAGFTALECAATYGRMAIVNGLLEQGANPNIRNQEGWPAWITTALLGVAKSTESLVATLIDHNADPSATTPDGRTAPEIFMANFRQDQVGRLDEVLANDRHAEGRRRLLDKLTADQRAAWLPKSCAVEAAALAAKTWSRKP